MNKQTFGQRLKEVRYDKKITQIALAEKLNVDKSTIAKYETDKIEPSISMLIELAKFFDVSTDYLLGLTDD